MDIAFTDEGAAESVELKPEGVDDDDEVSRNDPRLPAQSCELTANLLLSI
jgi:hypothetical protein